MVDFYSPGEAVRRSGLSLDTLRYYERIGLLDRVARDHRGRRQFDEGDLTWLRVLVCLRETGMPIARMRRYAELVRDGEDTIAERVDLLAEHDVRVEEQISTLRAQQEQLRKKLVAYREILANKEAHQ